jgi:DNA topoisomerase-3
MVRALNVAEKPSVARKLTEIFASRSRKQVSTRRVAQGRYGMTITEFDATCNGQKVDMVMTAVAGHMMGYEFDASFKSWQSCDPVALFEAPVVKHVAEDKKEMAEVLRNEAKKCQWLILWLDCDREGENIAFEVLDLCSQHNKRLQVFRAKFSALIPRDIFRAVGQDGGRRMDPPNKFLSEAVEARTIIDLRLGAAFTRFQTLRLQGRFQELSDQIVSYGPCQFPAVGFVVEQALKRERFVSEKFWAIKVEHAQQQPHQQQQQQQQRQRQRGSNAEFKWTRDRLFDQLATTVIYELCLESPTATVTHVAEKPKNKWRPLPLDTVEMQKKVSRQCHITGQRCMEVAEKLYQRGILSYPRTETQVFKEGTDLMALLANFNSRTGCSNSSTGVGQWSSFVDRLVQHNGQQGPGFKWPRKGAKDDQAHPPIHPTKMVELSTLEQHEAQVGL